MAEHVGHAWMQPCREYVMLDGSVKGICAISPEEASGLLERYVAIDPATTGFGGPVIGSYTLEKSDKGIVIHGQLNDPIQIGTPRNMSIDRD